MNYTPLIRIGLKWNSWMSMQVLMVVSIIFYRWLKNLIQNLKYYLKNATSCQLLHLINKNWKKLKEWISSNYSNLQKLRYSYHINNTTHNDLVSVIFKLLQNIHFVTICPNIWMAWVTWCLKYYKFQPKI